MKIKLIEEDRSSNLKIESERTRSKLVKPTREKEKLKKKQIPTKNIDYDIKKKLINILDWNAQQVI